jgi:hypothetical protein
MISLDASLKGPLPLPLRLPLSGEGWNEGDMVWRNIGERILVRYGMVREYQFVNEMDNKQPSKEVGGNTGR